METKSTGPAAAPLILGAVLILGGIAGLLASMEVFELRGLWGYWPLALIAIGIHKVLKPREIRKPQEGFWFLVIGGWLLLNKFTIFGLDYRESWPILIIAFGVSIVWEALSQPSNKDLAAENNNGE